jgi:hypothetical protein
LLSAGLLLVTIPVAAQVKTGELTSSLSGTIAPGYTADYGNMTGSNHSWALGGEATYSGSFYNPNFLSFNATVFINQSRANSDYQSISNASGVNVTGNIFSGSHYPGSVTYSKAYNSEGNYAVPGLANYVTHGNNDTFGVNWSENLPDAPSFSAGFQMGSSQYSVYGTDDQGSSAFHSLNLHSGYRVAGFNMGAYFTDGAGHSLIPEIVSGSAATEIDSSNTAYGFNLTHLLPLNGSISAGINRSGWNSDYLGTSSTGTIDLINSTAEVHPTAKLAASASVNYSDNLAGQLIQSVVAAGSAVPGVDSSDTSNSLDLLGTVSYTPITDLQASAFAERRTQTFFGENYGVESYGGNTTYGHKLLDGTFNASLGVAENTSDQTGEDSLGFSTTENYSTQVLGWHVTGSFSYAQNVQTLLVAYMNSFFNYSGTVRRRWGNLNFSAGAGAARTALTEQAGTSNSSQSYNASFGYGAWINATGSYSKAGGEALATGTGLVPVPVPVPTLPSGLVSLYGGDSFSFGLSSSPVKKLILTASYAKAISNTTSTSVTSANQNNEFNSLIQYQFRKLYFNSGYSRLEQGFSGSGTAPEVLSSFYIGVSRWFNFF